MVLFPLFELTSSFCCCVKSCCNPDIRTCRGYSTYATFQWIGTVLLHSTAYLHMQYCATIPRRHCLIRASTLYRTVCIHFTLTSLVALHLFSVLCFNQQSKCPFSNTVGHFFWKDLYQVWGLGLTSVSCVDAGHLGNLALLI